MRASRLSLVVTLLVAVACGRQDPCDRAPAPTPIDPATTGTISGTVIFTAALPASTPAQMNAECAALYSGPAPAGDVLVQNGRVQNVFVWLKDGVGSRVFAVPDTPVVVDQQGCMYQPRVVGAQVCQPIEFRNSDAFLHNVHGTPQQSGAWNFGLGVRGAQRTIRLDKPEVMVPVKCDVHPWMRAFIGVLEHPFFAVTGPDGQFELRGVPAGEYVVAVWHETLGTREVRVTLRAGETQTVGFSLGR